MLAVSGSINCIKHLQATAVEAGVDVDVFRLFSELGARVPVLSAVRPNGEDSIEAFEAAGGALALLKQLEPLLDTSVMTVTGRTLRENLENAVVHDEEVIRPLSRPFSDKAPIVILHGSLAPESAIVKLGLRGPDRKASFSGPAVVYEGGTEAIECIRQGRVKAGDVLVVRGMGPKGGPGMAGPASMVVFALDSAGLAAGRGLRDRRPALRTVQQGPHGGGSVARGRRRRAAVPRREWRSDYSGCRPAASGAGGSRERSSASGAHGAEPCRCRSPKAICPSISAACSRCRPAPCSVEPAQRAEKT